MKKIIKKTRKSKTLKISLLIGLVGILEVNLHLLQESIGADNYGFVVILISMIMFYLRTVSTESLDSKVEETEHSPKNDE